MELSPYSTDHHDHHKNDQIRQVLVSRQEQAAVHLASEGAEQAAMHLAAGAAVLPHASLPVSSF